MRTVPLGKLVTITIGKTPPRGDHTFWDRNKTGENAWLSIRDLQTLDGRKALDSSEYISDKGAELFRPVPKGTLLVSFKLTLGRLAFAGRDIYTNEAIAALHNDEKTITNEYLYYYLSYFDWYEYAKSDMKVKGLTLNKTKLGVLPVSFPESIEEQRRIVEMLDIASEKIDRAARLVRVNQINATSLFDASVEHLMDTLPPDVMRVKFSSAVNEIITGPFGSALHKADYVNSGTPVINPQNIKNGNIIALDKTMIGVKKSDELARYKLRANDIVMARRGEMGRCGLATAENEGWVCGTGSLIIRLNAAADPRYIVRYLRSGKTRKMLSKESVGMTMQNLNQAILLGLNINLPPIETQQRILKHLDELDIQTRELQSLYKRKLDNLEELKSALLSRAFNGDL